MPRHEFIVVDPDLCIGCEICESVCSFVHEGVFNPLLSRIKRVRIEPIVNIALSCQKCEDPDCVNACPQKALEKDEKTGSIKVNEDKCTGCAFCIRACPFGAISLSTESGIVLICDLCESTEYDEPQCIELCPREAISLKSVDQIGDENRIDAVKRLLSEMLEASK